MTDYIHFVRHTIADEGCVRTEYDCRAPEDAECRTWCDLCMKEGRGRCDCDYLVDEGGARAPVLSHGHECNILNFFSDAPDECYDGPRQDVRGPGDQPITTSLQGDYYVWKYAL